MLSKPKSKEKPPPSINKIMEEMSSPNMRSTLFARVVSGRRAEVLHKSKRGRYVKYRVPSGKLVDLAVAPTIRAAALRRGGGGKLVIKKIDLREKIRRRKISTLINIILDTSGSMIEKRKVEVTSNVIIELLKDAYQRRDKVALTTYSDRAADVPLQFTSSVELAKGFMENVSFGGTTPLSAGMLTGLNILLSEMMKGLVAIPLMVLITDGVANVPLEVGGNIERELKRICHIIKEKNVNMLVVDISEQGAPLALDICKECGGRYLHQGGLTEKGLYRAIKTEQETISAY